MQQHQQNQAQNQQIVTVDIHREHQHHPQNHTQGTSQLAHNTYAKAAVTQKPTQQHLRQSTPPSRKKQHLHNAKPSILKSRIIADSTCSRIRKNDIDEIIDTRQEEVSINKFPNAEADEILHYSQYHLVKDCPDNIVIVAGLNDLLHSEDRANADCKLIADKVIKIGRVAREKGVARVCISGLVKPKYYNCRAPVDTINGYLMDNCSREGFVYLDQGNIQASDMGDMVHVGNQGLSKLRDNIYKGLFTYSSSSANGRDRD